MKSRAYAADHPWPFHGLVQRDLPTLRAAWHRTGQLVREMQRLLRLAELPDCVCVVAASGSLGRMEFHSRSDVDLIVVVDDDGETAVGAQQAAYSSVWQALSPLELKPPRSKGIFSRASTWNQLCTTHSLGQVDEPLHVFGHRFQLLLDCQPLYGTTAYEQLLDAVLERYARGDVLIDDRRQWQFLQNDLVRYYRSLCINYQWQYRADDPARWRIRNVKLDHSRQLLYASMLLLLGESSRQQQKFAWLRQRLPLTPLERVAHVFAAHNDAGFGAFAGCYEQFLCWMTDAGWREALARRPEQPAGEPEQNDAFQQSRANAARMRRQLTCFLLARRPDWASEFFENFAF